MPYPVFDLHSDTADRLAWQTLPQAIKDRVGMDAYGPGDADHLSDICDPRLQPGPSFARRHRGHAVGAVLGLLHPR